MPNLQMAALLVTEAMWQSFRYDFVVRDTPRNRLDFAALLANYLERSMARFASLN